MLLSPLYYDAATAFLGHETHVRHVRRLTGLTPVSKPDFTRIPLLDKFFYVVPSGRRLWRTGRSDGRRFGPSVAG